MNTRHFMSTCAIKAVCVHVVLKAMGFPNVPRTVSDLEESWNGGHSQLVPSPVARYRVDSIGKHLLIYLFHYLIYIKLYA